MSLMDAKEYDPRPARRLRWAIGAVALLLVIGFIGWWFFRYWPEEHVINRFFQALERQDYESAYGIYQGDADWKRHPEKYPEYPLPQFKLDWGPSSDYGPITSHTIDCSTEPKKQDFQSASGVIVVVTINKRSESTSLWVEKKNKSITTSPLQALCHPPK